MGHGKRGGISSALLSPDDPKQDRQRHYSVSRRWGAVFNPPERT